MSPPALVIKLKSRTVGVHTTVRVFVGPDHEHLAHTGSLMMGVEQWPRFHGVILAGAIAAKNGTVVITEKDKD